MYEAAIVILTRVKRAPCLKDWAQAIAKWSGAGKVLVALARKLSAMRFMILTVPRTSEVTGATWREMRLDGEEWVVPTGG